MSIDFEFEQDAEDHAIEREHGDARNRLAVQMLRQVRDSVNHIIQLLEEGDTARAQRHMVDFVSRKQTTASDLESLTGARVLEGVFSGESMVGSDGVRYNVPPNYASKSKLVEGDILKLTIRPDGSYLFKQIGPIQRKRVIGKLTTDPATQCPVVVCQDDVYKVLEASVSYYKGVIGDEVVVLVPLSDKCVWAAVENIVK